MRLAALVVLAALLAPGCQPWYRDAARRGRIVLDEGQTTDELSAASAQREAGDPARAAAILEATVHRNPRAQAEVWLALVDATAAAGQGTRARAYARWALARVSAQDPDADPLRARLIDLLASARLVAAALDLVEPPTLEAALAHPALAEELGELGLAVRHLRLPDMARMRLGFWLARYGEPDHPILRAAHAQITQVLVVAATAPDATPAVAALGGLSAIVHDELAAGHVEAALIAYAEARWYLPREALPVAALERAAAARGITALLPEVHARARAADAALAEGDLGAALAGYRAVVQRAPWWPAARANLEALLVAAR